jgi:tetratricopeptide (TPR) repeat protein
MRLVRLFSLSILLLGSSGLSAQIPTRRPAAQAAATAVRLLVGNPHSFSAQDSLPAVTVGDGLRNRMDKLVNGQFRVLSRVEMNDALIQFGYPKDAILAPLPQRSLAQSLNARVMVTSSLNHDPGGKYTVTARLAGLNDDAGHVVSLTQPAGLVLPDLGSKVAEGFQPALKSWADAKGCVDQAKSAPDKATQSAKKALAVLPNHGLANVCLGQMALARGRKADSAEALGYFQAAVKGDPLSLNAWTQLAAGYEVAGDTSNTIAALRQMLAIAPTNQPLRDLVFKKFLAYGHPEDAEEVADQGLKIDPGNIDMYELRANARIFRENYTGALEDLEQIIGLDSIRADTMFYVKYLVTASQKPDTARLVRWSSQAVKRFPDNVTLLKQVAGAYSQVGLPDSLLGTLGLVVKYDTAAAVGFALQEAKNRQDAKQYPQAGPFIDFAVTYGDAQAKEGAAGLLLNGTLPLIQPPQDWKGAAEGFRKVITIANPAGRYAPIANYFLGLSLVNLIVAADKEAESQKSCDGARQVEAMTAEGEGALAKAQPYIDGPGAGQKATHAQLKGYLGGLKARTASMIRVYCK